MRTDNSVRKKNTDALEVLSWVPAIIVIGVIFYLSSQKGDASDNTSIGLIDCVTKGNYHGISIKTINSAVRVFAHITEYFILSLCVGIAVTANHIKGKMRFLYMCLISITVSVADEFYQIFIPGRYGDFKDIACDGLGIVVAAFIVLKIGKSSSNIDSISSKRQMLGISIDNITFDEAVKRVCDMAEAGDKGRYILTPNVDHMIKIQKDKLFKEIYDHADLIVTDGTPLMWIAESTGEPIKEKIPGSDMLPRVCEEAAKRNIKIFLFGAAKGVAKEAAKELKNKYKGLKIVGTYSPPSGFEKDEDELEKAFAAINEAKTDIVVMGLGSPKQEKLIYKYRDRIDAKVFLPFGAAIDFEAGRVKRAPLWMRDRGMEWFYRFINEPGRLFKRYFVDDLKIFWITWKYRRN